MPISFELDTFCIRTTMKGVVDAEDVARHIDALKKIESANKVFIELVDLHEVDDLQINSDFAHELSQKVKSLHAKYTNSHIIVIAKNEAQYGINRMLQTWITMSNPTVEWYISPSLDDAEEIMKSIITEK